MGIGPLGAAWTNGLESYSQPGDGAECFSCEGGNNCSGGNNLCVCDQPCSCWPWSHEPSAGHWWWWCEFKEHQV